MSTPDADLHPIQLERLTVKRLRIDIWDANRAEDFDGDVNLSFQNAHGSFDKDESTISVGVRALVGEDTQGDNFDEDATPFFIEVEFFGLFSVDTTTFEEHLLPRWARMNAPFLLLPYVREHVYGLASRAGIKGLILPLFVQPQFRPQANDS